MFYRGQLCELDFQILDHKQCPPKPPKKFFLIIFTPLLLGTQIAVWPKH